MGDQQINDQFLPDGFERLIEGVEAEIRLEVEQKYAGQLEGCRFVKRWLLLRQIRHEVAELARQRTESVSPQSLF
ncbi:hypothetical protein [Rhodopirellula sp. MGV]|uniref:hypothetical protein n=1 Tax=Rhodopirellula sp. MGV TaxID=2023130 RepID=UPI000B96C385|nr:hypothetical protein [Rhodopirellula sp. MGV]OYP37681.1 hypothetical protein CGZ80_04125 [Rhodopirellula sp. MGV]